MATSYHLEYRQGRPVIVSSLGETILPSCYCDCITSDFPAWIARNRDFVEDGVHLYFLTPKGDWTTMAGLYWTDDGVYPQPSEEEASRDIEGQARAILEMDPLARFYVRLGESIPKAWAEKHPGEMQLSSSGHRMDQLSLAAEYGWEHFDRYLRNFIEYCEARPWADRIVGYTYFPMGEGLTNLAVHGYAFDASAAMQLAFQSHVRSLYADENALREAWGSDTPYHFAVFSLLKNQSRFVDPPKCRGGTERLEVSFIHSSACGNKNRAIGEAVPIDNGGRKPASERMAAVRKNPTGDLLGNHFKLDSQKAAAAFRPYLFAIGYSHRGTKNSLSPVLRRHLNGLKRSTGIVPLPANLLRECCRHAGSHIWCEEDDVILASETLAAVHSLKAGPRTLHLPTPRTVWDLLSGEKLGDQMTRIELGITPP